MSIVPPGMQDKISKFYEEEARLRGSQQSGSGMEQENTIKPPACNFFDAGKERGSQKVYSFPVENELNKKLRIRIGGEGKIYAASLLSESATVESNPVEIQNIWVGTDNSDSSNPLSEISGQHIPNVLENIKGVQTQGNKLILVSKV